MLRLSERVLRTQTAEALHYGRTDILHGFAGLRQQLAARAGLELPQVMLTSGGAHAISLACQAVVRPGDVVAVEIPTWGYMLREIDLAGAEAMAVPTDRDGLRVDVLAALVDRRRREGRHVRAVYVIPNFSVPTGACLSLERRRDLVALAQQERMVIIEDNTYGELRYRGDDLASLQSLDEEGLVVKVDSFSKVLAPALRLGWVSGDRRVIAGLAAVRRDLGVSQWMARTVHAFLEEGLLEPHLAAVRNVYRRKCDAAAAALSTHGREKLRWRQPDGGFFYWLEFATGLDVAAVMQAAAQQGVVCRPGERFFGDLAAGSQHVRLAFSMYPEADLEAGIATLAAVI